MKARINNDNSFAGLYTEDFLEKNIEFTAQWVLTNMLPSINIKKPIFENNNWIESVSLEELNEMKLKKIEVLRIQKKQELSITDDYVIESFELQIPIPEDVKIIRAEIRLKYEQLILDINTEISNKSSRKN